MAGLLSGLESFGLGKLADMKVYDAPEEKKEAVQAAPKIPVMQEQDFLFDKSYVCPVCEKEFKEKTVKVGKAKLKSTDMDLRPRYEGIDMIKYDVIMCPGCGYTALSRYFKFVSGAQAKLIREQISVNFKAKPENGEVYSYEEALERYKLTLANAIVKRAKVSEKAYICLKTAWLLRGMGEALEQTDKDYTKKKEEYIAQEKEFLQNAMDGFLAARQSEEFPMCGMDENTVDYLIAVMALRFNQYDVSTRLIGSILTSASANPRMKEKARNLKEILMTKIKQQHAGKK